MDQVDCPVPELADQNLSTLIRIQIENKDHQDQIKIEVERLRNTRFRFIGLRKPKEIKLLINGQFSSTSTGGWEIGSTFNFDAKSAEAQLAKEAEHPVNTPAFVLPGSQKVCLVMKISLQDFLQLSANRAKNWSPN